MGDEEYNPLAQYDDLDAKRQAEVASKQVVSEAFLTLRDVNPTDINPASRKKSQLARHNM